MLGVAVACAHLFAGEVAAAQLDALLASAEAAYADVVGQYSGQHATADGTSYLGGDFTLSARSGSATSAATPGRSSRLLALTNPRYAADVQSTPDGWALTWLAATRPPEFSPALAVCGVVGEGVSHRRLLAGRAGPPVVTANRAGHTLAFPTGERRVEFDVANGRLTGYRLTNARGGVTTCGIVYAGGETWPALQQVVVEYQPGRDGPQHAYRTDIGFLRYARLSTPLPVERFTLTSVSLPEPAAVPASPERYPPPPDPADSPPPDSRGPWWAIGGILAAGAVAFAWVGRRPGGTRSLRAGP